MIVWDLAHVFFEFRYDILVVARYSVPGKFGLYFIGYFFLSSIIILKLVKV